MKTTTNTVETVSTPRGMTFDTNNIESSKKTEHEKNTREPLEAVHARKSQFLIVDEEWW